MLRRVFGTVITAVKCVIWIDKCVNACQTLARRTAPGDRSSYRSCILGPRCQRVADLFSRSFDTGWPFKSQLPVDNEGERGIESRVGCLSLSQEHSDRGAQSTDQDVAAHVDQVVEDGEQNARYILSATWKCHRCASENPSILADGPQQIASKKCGCNFTLTRKIERDRPGVMIFQEHYGHNNHRF